MIVVNFAHPLTAEQRAGVEQQSGQAIERVIDVKTQFDPGLPYAGQAQQLLSAAGLSADEWQTLPLLISLPSYNAIAALLLAELHGRCGYFPAILRLRPVPDTTPPRFEVAEIINLQTVRDGARDQR